MPESALAALPEGTYYEHDLIGCRLVTTDGREVGTVRTVEGGGGMIRLVAGSGRGEIQVPLVHEICVRIDVAQQADRDRSAGGTAGRQRVSAGHAGRAGRGER